MLANIGKPFSASPDKQRGVVLLITLIVLVAMTLASIAMVRSVDTTNLIAGNLAFHQAATHSADSGIEAAVTWLEANNGTNVLYSSSSADGYVDHLGVSDSPTGTATWNSWWTSHCENEAQCKTLGSDTIGNTTQYIVHRLCSNSNGPPDNTCIASVAKSSDSSNKGNEDESNKVVINSTSQIYYRITVKVIGPRNSVSYVQATVAL